MMPRSTHDQMMISDEPFLPGGGKPIKVDFLKDPISQMTYGRRIALSLMDKAWYYPPSKPPRRPKDKDADDDDSDDDDDDSNDDSEDSDSDSDDDDDDTDDEEGKERIEVFEDEPDNIEDFSLPHSGRTMMVVPGVGGAKGSNLSKSDLMVMAGRHNNHNNNNDDDDKEKATMPPPTSPRSMSVETRPPTVTRLERPSLAKAWAFFEHTTLPRYIVEEEYDGYGNRIRKQHELARAEPGENEEVTNLYDPVRTHSSQLGDFGLGIGLYFSTLWGVVILTFVAGLLNVPNILYFSSEEYSQGQPGVTFLLKGSAICTDTTWVPCPTCDPAQFESSRFATTTVDLSMLGMTSSSSSMLTTNNTDPPLSTNVTLQFALRNNCIGATIQEGFINYGTLVLVVLGLILISWRQKHHEIVFDEDEQTAQDYSVHIKNPPPDAFDPEEWRKFFRDRCNGAHATSVTIALDNDLLVRTLLERRECLRRIELLVEPGTALDALSLARLAAQIDKRRSKFARFKARFAGGVPELFGKIASLDARIEGLAQLDYQVSNVFCSFEYEEHQREVLHLLSASDFNVSRQHSAGGITFRDRVLAVEEPQEPSTIIWQNLNERPTDLLKELITTSISAMVAIFLLALLIQFLHRTQHPYVAAAAISICNSVFPQIAKMLTSFEKHSSESQKQTSLYFKINVFRWVNTAVVITIVTPFTRTLANGGLLSSVYAIFFAEIITSNAVQLADVMGHVHRHLLAPRSTTQDMMNLHMIGTDFELAERYTVRHDMCVCVCVFVCVSFFSWCSPCVLSFFILWEPEHDKGSLFGPVVLRNISGCIVYVFGSIGSYVLRGPVQFDGESGLAWQNLLLRLSFLLLLRARAYALYVQRTWRRKPMLGTTIARFSRQYFFSGAVVAKAIVASYTWAGFPYDDLCGKREKRHTLDFIIEPTQETTHSHTDRDG